MLAALEKQSKQVSSEELGKLAEELAASGEKIGGVNVVVARAPSADQKALLNLANRVEQRVGDGAVVLGGAEGETTNDTSHDVLSPLQHHHGHAFAAFSGFAAAVAAAVG